MTVLSSAAASHGSGAITWNTAFTKAFHFVRLPIMSAPMAGVAGGLLAAETCRAGGLGFIAVGYNDDHNLAFMEDQIQLFRQKAPTNAPLSLGFIGFAAFADASAWDRYEYLLQTHQPQVVQCFAPSIMVRPTTHETNVQLAHSCNAKFLAQVGNYAEAQQAIDAGVDGLIAQGCEAGGHGLRRDLGSSTLCLTSLLASRFPDVPILVAGGIMTGKDMAAALALGGSGVVLGTRLWASRESIGPAAVQQQLLLQKTCDDVIRTTVFDQFNNAVAPVKWPRPYDSVGALRNEATQQWDGRFDELQSELEKATENESQVLLDFQQAQATFDPAQLRVLCGEGIGHVESIEGAYDIIMRVEQEAKDRIRGLATVLSE